MHWLLKVLEGSWITLTQMAPFLLMGFLFAGALSVFINADTVRRHLGRGRYLPVIKAALFGVPLPLCSCGVIPVAASLRRQGASRGATAAFLLSTPQTGVDSLLVTWSLLGAAFALFTPGAAFASGILAGLLVDRFGGPDRPPSRSRRIPGGGPASLVLKILRHAYVILARDIATPLAIGIGVAG
ncbi:MAG: permease [Kiritimatiellia bacterium]